MDKSFVIEYLDIDGEKHFLKLEHESDCDPDSIEDAVALLNSETMYKRFGRSGARNDSAVNSLIALRVLYPGHEAAWYADWMYAFAKNSVGLGQTDLNLFEEHLDRVAPYLEDWGPDGCEDDALAYQI